jgi:hypothetical protein
VETFEWSEDWGSPLVEPEYDAEFDAAAKRLLGFRRTPDCLFHLLPAEWVAVTTLPLFMRHDAAAAPPELTDLVAYLTAEADGCRYTAGLSAARLRLLGRQPEELGRLAAVVRGTVHSDETLEDRLANMARAVVRAAGPAAGDPPEGGARRAVAQLSEHGLSGLAARELAACAVQACFFDSVCSLLSIPPFYEMERMPDSLLIKLVRPIIARSLRGRQIDVSGLAVAGPRRKNFLFPALLRGLRGTWYEAWSFTAVDRWFNREDAGSTGGIRLKVMERILGEMGAKISASQVAAAATGRDAILPAAVEQFALQSLPAVAGNDGGWRRSGNLVSYLSPAELVDLVGTAALARFVGLAELLLGPARTV